MIDGATGCARTLRARARKQIEAMVPDLPWEHFDAWTWWAKTAIGTYRVNERQGRWTASIGFGTSSIHRELQTSDNTEESAKAACQSEFARMATDAVLDAPKRE